MEDTGKDISYKEAPTTETTSIPEVLIKRAVLYHGSGVSGISSFLPAEETTIGQGVYLTSDQVSAEGYAKRRSGRDEGKRPVVYEVEVRDLRLADLREMEGVDNFARLLGDELELKLKKPKLSIYWEEAARRTLDKIKKHSFRSLKDITWNHQDIVTRVIQANGFDGLVAIEGGEGQDVGEHDSFVVFDPSKATIIRESE